MVYKNVLISLTDIGRHVAVVAKFLDLNKPWSCLYGGKKKHENIDMCDLCVIALG